MKTLFIHAKINFKVDKSRINSISKKLPKNIAIAYSIQYQEIAKEIKKILSKNHKITKFIQILGCSQPVFLKSTKAILLISSGKFHAISLAFETKIPVYVLEDNHLKKISKKEVEILEKKQKASYVKFLNSNKIGILVSTKPGQQNMKKALNLKKTIKDKNSYLFLCNNININEFENFEIDSWVNTACRRVDLDDSSIINITKIK